MKATYRNAIEQKVTVKLSDKIALLKNSRKPIRTFVKTGKEHYTDRHRDSRTGKDGREET